MIGKIVAFVAVAVSCSTALPFGSCGPWDSPAFPNLVTGPTNVISTGLNLPGPTPIIEGPSFPGNNIITPTANILPPTTNILPPPTNIIAQTVPTSIPNFPAPTVTGPIGIQRFAGPITFPNIPLPGPIVQTAPVPVHNIETRVPTIHARFPTVHARFQPFETSLPAFPTVQGTGVLQANNSPFPC